MNSVRHRGYIYKFTALFMPLIFIAGCSGKNPIESVVNKEEQLKGNMEILCTNETKSNIEYAVQLFKGKNPQVNIKLSTISESGIDNDFKARDAAGEDYPDLLEVNTSQIPVLLDKYPGMFLELDNDIKKIGDKFLHWKLDEVTFNKNIYAYPWDSAPKVMLYNKDLADKYGIEPEDIKTWEDYRKFGVKLVSMTSGKIKLIALKENMNGSLFTYMMRQLKTPIYKDTGSIELPKTEFIKSLASIKGLYDNKLIYELKDNEDALNIFTSGQVLSIIAGVSDVKKVNENRNNSQKWQVEKIPAFENGGKDALCGEGNGFMVIKKEAQNEVVSKFMKFMLTDSECTIFAFKNSGIITSVPELYSLPLFNEVSDNFPGKRIWRFIAEEVKEENAVTYYPSHDKIIKSLIQMESDVISGKNTADVIKLKQEELNKP